MLNHNFPSPATGVAIPHGFYDLNDKIGFIQIATSHDTSEFACDSIRYWWNNYGKRYQLATSILLLCDGGGSNSSRYYVFKQALQTLVNEIGIEKRKSSLSSLYIKVQPNRALPVSASESSL